MASGTILFKVILLSSKGMQF